MANKYMLTRLFLLLSLAASVKAKRITGYEEVEKGKSTVSLQPGVSNASRDGPNNTNGDVPYFACCCIVPGTELALKVQALKGWGGISRASVYTDSSRKHFVRRIDKDSVLKIPPTSPQPWFKRGGRETSDTWFQVDDGPGAMKGGWVSFHPAYEKVDYYEGNLVSGTVHTYLTYDYHTKRFKVIESDTTKQSRCWSGARLYGDSRDPARVTEKCKQHPEEEGVYMAQVIGGVLEEAKCESTFNGKSKTKFEELLKSMKNPKGSQELS